MLVDARQLRNRGVKRSREDVHACAPLRASLQVSAGRPGWHGDQRDAPLMAGLVEPGRTQWAWPPLDQARVVRIEGSHVLVVGIETIQEGRKAREFRQSWWCQIVDPATTTPAHSAGAPTPNPPTAQPPIQLQVPAR